MLIDELIDYAASRAADRRVLDLRAGLGYTAVLLEDRACGLAYTFRNRLGSCCGVIGEAGSLIGMPCEQLIPWAKSRNLLMAAMGLAAINAVLNDPAIAWEEGNVATAFRVGSTDTFGMVGEFPPILGEVRKRTNHIYVFEQDTEADDGLYPEEAMGQYLPACDVVVITATSLINQTVDGVLAHCKQAREVCLVGPSAPLCPEVLRRHGVTLLAGSVVKNPELLLRIVSQGGGTMSMKPAVRQVVVRG